MLLATLLFLGLVAGQDRETYEYLSVNYSTPANNAPLNKTLAYYKLNGTNGPSSQLTQSFVSVSCGAEMAVHHTEPWVFPDAVCPLQSTSLRSSSHDKLSRRTCLFAEQTMTPLMLGNSRTTDFDSQSWISRIQLHLAKDHS